MENLWINLVVDYKEKKIGLFSFKLSHETVLII